MIAREIAESGIGGVEAKMPVERQRAELARGWGGGLARGARYMAARPRGAV
jgi:hypothetical protein